MSFLSDLWQSIGEKGRDLIGFGKPGAVRTPGDLTRLAGDLLSGRGEASGVAIAQEILDAYGRLDAPARRAFLVALAEGFGPDSVALEEAMESYHAKPSPAAIMALHRAAEPRRQELIRRLNLAPGGTAALVRLREEVLASLRDAPVLEALDADLAHLFSSWFNRGFLVLRRIDWSTPANILEKIIRYEAVHAIHDWDDLRRRLEPPDRRLYAFFHPQLADDPLIFVEVALTREIPNAIGPLLAQDRAPLDPARATTAVFYSISNCQAGLARISFGHFLIKQVVEELKRELPGLRTFVTLSPVPGFRAWLEHEADDPRTVLSSREREAVAALGEAGWPDDAQRARELEGLLMPLAAFYLAEARSQSGKPLDSVARFHLGNGARLERINWLADRSSKAMKAAAGIMVNYLYDLDAIVENHEAYANENKVVASPAVRKLMRGTRSRSEVATIDTPA
jgi:malonyl-CoA decarboxylase